MSANRIKILVFSDWYLPGFRAGGPIRSLANLVNALDMDFYIITRNKDHNNSEPYSNIETGKWISQLPNVNVCYLEDSQLNRDSILSISGTVSYDRIYLNSLFSPKFTQLPLRIFKKLGQQNKVVLAPRGMLKAGALSVKPLKKKLFLLYAKISKLYEGITWHATSPDEAIEIRKHIGAKAKVMEAPNLSLLPVKQPTKTGKKNGVLNLLSVARISPEKGIHETLQYLKSARLNGSVCMHFYGTQQNETYFRECKSLAQSIPRINIEFYPEIAPEKLPECFSRYHFFISATWGENFGHAILEALGNSLPVIISDKTPWKNLELAKAGWTLESNTDNFAQKLNYCLNMDSNEYVEWTEGARRYAEKIITDPLVLAASYRLFQ